MIRATTNYDAITIDVLDDAAQDVVTLVNTIQMRMDDFIERNGGDLTAVTASGSTVLQAEIDAFLNGVQRIVGDSVNRAWRSAYAQELNTRYGMDDEFAWRVESKKPCPDCSNRSGETRTLYEWNLAGLPKSGWSICGNSCHCTLEKV
jgi:hypothetical protein